MKIQIIGAGEVGKAVGKGFALKGHKVIFVDVLRDVILKLRNQGYEACLLDEIKGKLKSEVSIFCVQTPTKKGKQDLSFLKEAVIKIAQEFRKSTLYHLFVIKSTILPQSTRTEVIPLIEKSSGKKVGRDFGICVNPEFLRQKSADQDFINPRVTVVGEYDAKSGDLMEGLYSKFEAKVHRISLEEAEFMKYVHNLLNAAKITFFNDLRSAAKALRINPDKVFSLSVKSAEGIWNPEYGIYDYGPFEGKCLPKDIKAFISWAEQRKIDISLVKEIEKINEEIVKIK